MAEILIPVKNPPKNCHECKNGWCNLWEQNKNMTTGKHPDCPMKELPPHKELCDKDKLKEATKNTVFQNSRGEVYQIGKAIAMMIDQAPVVVEATE